MTKDARTSGWKKPYKRKRGDKMTPKAKRTKAKLLETAKQLFKEKGYENVSVEKITKASQVAKGTFYHYFTKKEDIVLELIFKSIKNKQEEVLASENSIDMKICEYMKTVFEEIDYMPKELLRNWVCDSIQGTEKYPQATIFPKNIKKFIYELFTKEVKAKRLKETIPEEKISHILVTRIYGFIATWCILGKTESLSEYALPVVNWEVKKILDSYENKV